MKRNQFVSVAALVLAIVACLGLCACNSTPAPSPSPTPGFNTPTTAAPDTVTDPPVLGDDEPEEIFFTKEQLAQANIVLAKGTMLKDSQDGYVYSAVA